MATIPRGLRLLAPLIAAAWSLLGLLTAADAQPGATPAHPAVDTPAVDNNDARYGQLIDYALLEYEQGHFAEAHALFSEAHALKPSARALRGLGFASFELRDYARALQELSAALEDQRQPLTDEQRTEVSGMLERTKQYLGSLQVLVTPADAAVLLDGVPWDPTAGNQALALGSHTLTVHAPGYVTVTRDMYIEGGQQQTLPITLAPLDLTPRPSDTPSNLGTDTLTPTAPLPAGEPHESVFGKAWFWGGVAGVVAVGALVAILATRTPDPRAPEKGNIGGTIALPGESP